MNSWGEEVRHQDTRSPWCGVQGGKGEWWWWWRSAEWNCAAQIQAKERLSSGAAHLSWDLPKGRGVQSVEWNRGTPDRNRGEDWVVPILEEGCWQKCRMERWMKYGSAYPDWGAPAEENHGGGGGVWSSPPFEIDECRGFCSSTIHHLGRAKFISIFILRKHNCNLLSAGILKKPTMNSCGHEG